ncbi:zinc-binding dehydrogenase [Parahaliea maris]|uniref:Zinc-binding dehydrogenase n=1 Tax=Parahaliea maris TaxID=2716870 RepID=A0A5C8ZMZ1_9GAMM|nr:zinc-binding dehydrogenase [Parahaliea maris]TXS89828.1 zinc-binding dehydrogenase [Parahaliea maris]
MQVGNYISPGHIDFRTDATRPKPGPGELLIHVKRCGICGSDLHMFRDGSLRERIVRQTPEGYEVPGHELAGVVAEVGQDVEGWSVGDRVVAIPGYGGGMAEFMTVPVNPYQVVAIPDSVDFDAAATTEPMADALQMVRLADVQPNEHIVIFGVGIIGLGVIQALKAKGIQAGSIIAIDVQEARLDKALELGATSVIDGRQKDLLERVAEATGEGVKTDFDPSHANIGVVFDCAGYSSHFGRPVPLETALEIIAPGRGRIICFGSFSGEATLNLHNIVRKQATVKGSFGYQPQELLDALEMMRSGAVDRNTLISHHFPLEKIDSAFSAQMGADAIKVIIDIPETG